MPSQIRKLPKHRSQTVKSLVFTFWLGGNFLLTLQLTFGINRLSVERVFIMVIINGFHSWVMEFPRNFLMRFVKLASVLVLRSTAMAFRTSCSFQSRTETACSYRSNFKNFELESDVCRVPIAITWFQISSIIPWNEFGVWHLQTADCTADCRLLTTDCRLQTGKWIKVMLVFDAALKSSLAISKRRISDRNEINSKISQRWKWWGWLSVWIFSSYVIRSKNKSISKR